VRAETSSRRSIPSPARDGGAPCHQRHKTRAAANQQQRPAVLHAPCERAADRPAHLEAVARPQLADQVGRDLAVVDSLDGQLEAGSSGAEAIEYERCAW